MYENVHYKLIIKLYIVYYVHFNLKIIVITIFLYNGFGTTVGL